MRISTWNVQWATPRSARGKRVSEILAALESSQGCTVVAGDFNQRIPRTSQPEAAAQSLMETLVWFEVPTASVIEPQLIDHIAHSSDLVAVGQPMRISNVVDGAELSDHTGVSIQLTSSRHP